MSASVYYNEIDLYCAQWLRNLMDADMIPRGDIDTRSIEDVIPNDLRGYTQCHFFAGLGGWAYALQLAGWGTRPVWTGSCPCQPFSAAGKGAGFADERHLWPAWQHLIAQCRPAVIFGEQVASKAVDAWIDLVHADLEGMGYAFGGIAFPSAGVGAPHIRDRTYWVADAAGSRCAKRWESQSPALQGECAKRSEELTRPESTRVVSRGSEGLGACIGGLAAADHAGLEGWGSLRERSAERAAGSRGVAGRLADTNGRNASAEREQRGGEQRQQPQDGGAVGLADAEGARGRQDAGAVCEGKGERIRDSQGENIGRPEQQNRWLVDCSSIDRPGPANGFWRAADWLGCTDGKWRPVEPGTFPLVDGATSRVGRLRAYGNAIVPQAAAAFITAYMQARGLIANQQAVAA